MHPITRGNFGLKVILAQGVLNAPGGWAGDALVDRECVPQVRGAFAGITFQKVGAAEPFEGACFLRGRR